MSSRKPTSFGGYESASDRASRTMAANTKKWTRCERLLDQALRQLELYPVTHRRDLPGRPAFVFSEEKVIVFVDGDFWHGRDWPRRKQRLRNGHNAKYWVAKIQANIDRDQRQERELSERGWTVVRLWETDVVGDSAAAAHQVARTLERGGCLDDSNVDDRTRSG